MVAEVADGETRGGVASRSALRRFVSTALAAPTGPGLLTGLLGLAARGDLSAREAVEVTAGWARMIAFCTAGQLSGVRDVDTAFHPTLGAPRDDVGPRPVAPVADGLAPALGIAPQTASRLVGLARRVEKLPAAADALADGRMSLGQLAVTDQVTRDLPDATIREVEATAVRWAPRKTTAQLRVALAAEAARLDPSHATTAATRGVAERDVTWRPSPLPGCRRLVADLPMVEGAAAWLAVNTAARNAKKAGARPDLTRPDVTPETRTLPQLRADFLTALLTGQTHTDDASVPTPDQLAHLAEVHVVVAYDTLTEAADLPAHLPGTGPVDPATARLLATRAPWRRLVAHPDTGALVQRDSRTLPPPAAQEGARQRTGEQQAGEQLVAEQRTAEDQVAVLRSDPRLARILTDALSTTPSDDGTRYRPSRRLRDQVHARDATCLGPACSHPATGTQLDHTINHGERDHRGVLGHTGAGNLGSLCERVHNAKTHGGWHLEQPAPGAFVWTSPTGRTYHRRARPLVPGWRHRREQRTERPPPRSGAP